MIRIFFITFFALVALAGVTAAQPGLPDTARSSGYRFFDAPIDPDHYLIRPGDQLQVTFIGAQLAPLLLTINPEGRVVHSTLGSYDFQGVTLAEVRRRLGEALGRLYNVEDIDISVLTPRRVAIQVSGTVESPGLYLAYTSQRVSEVIDSAGGVGSDGSRREIRLLGGPKEIRVDLDRADLGEAQWNPALYAGHTVIVPAKSTRVVNVVGEVERPREMEILAGETVDDIIALVGPLRATADSSAIRVIRGSEQIVGTETVLQPGDIVLVPLRQEAAGEAPVTVFGAVQKPGRYEIESSNHLDALINRAGGFTEHAAPTGLTVFRHPPREASVRVEERYAIGNLVDGDAVVRPFALQTGDSVFVPVAVGYVRVSGEVRNPGMFPFVAGQSAKDYVSAAGGFLPRADREVVEIFHRVSRFTETRPAGARIQDGDEVIVRLREEFR